MLRTPNESIESVFAKACAEGKADVVKELLAQGTLSINPSTLESLLFWGCKVGSLELVQFLIASYHLIPSIHQVQQAAGFGHTAVVEFLIINYEIDISEVFNYACACGQTDLVKLLLKNKKVDPAANNNKAVLCACREGYSELVLLLLSDKRVHPEINNNQLFIEACKKGLTEVVMHLLGDNRVDPTDNNNEAILNACRRRHIALVMFLLGSERVDPAANGNQLIIAACLGGHMDLVQFLLGYERVDPSADESKALFYACTGYNRELVLCLLADPRVDPTSCDNRALKQLCKFFDPTHQLLKLFLDDPRISLKDKQQAIRSQKDKEGFANLLVHSFFPSFAPIFEIKQQNENWLRETPK